jgi:hypothetical protein
MDPGAALAKKAGSTLLGFLKNYADPDKRKALDAEITNYLLSEVPRIILLIEERDRELRAAGCTPLEAQVIAYQTLEDQKRTLDTEKRARLTNVLVNGLCDSKRDAVKHRLLLRLTSELEEEHIDRLRRYTMDAHQLRAQAPTEPYSLDREYQERLRESNAVEDALRRELVARGLLEQETKPKLKKQRVEVAGQTPLVEDLELVTTTNITRLGRALLEYLKDPAPPSNPTAE